MLQIQNLCKVFNRGTVNENRVFEGFNINVNKGDFITIIGSNGAGKSTLLNIISGNIHIDIGSIKLQDKEISDMPEYKCSRYIGRVFQNPSMGAAPNMTIMENMSMALNKGKTFGLSMGASKKNVEKFKKMLLELNLGLEDKLDTKVGLLSGGQRQALSLIMTVMSKPKVLLLDEHTAALDPKTSEKIIEITQKIVRENNITTLMVTHNLNHAISIGNRIIMMDKGRVVIDINGEEKKKLTTEKLLTQFEKNLSDRTIFS